MEGKPVSQAAENSAWFFSCLICQLFSAVTVLSTKPQGFMCPGETVIVPSLWLKKANLLQLFSKTDAKQAGQ